MVALLLRMKVCLVTVGATASFRSLIEEVLSEPFLAQLQRHKYTHLLVQYGKDAQSIFDNFMNEIPDDSNARHGISVAGFDFVSDMSPYIQMVRQDDANGSEQGLMISHAGKRHLKLTIKTLIVQLNFC